MDQHTPRNMVAEMLRTHDWTHEYSDDLRVYSRGLADRIAIVAVLETLPMSEIAALIAEFVPPAQHDAMLLELARKRADRR